MTTGEDLFKIGIAYLDTEGTLRWASNSRAVVDVRTSWTVEVEVLRLRERLSELGIPGLVYTDTLRWDGDMEVISATGAVWGPPEKDGHGQRHIPMNPDDHLLVALRRAAGYAEIPRVPAAGVKHDREKVRTDLLPADALEAIAKVLTLGAKKYAPNNWRKVRGWRWRYYGAALRHLFAWWGGERNDPETGEPHLAHAACCVLFLLSLDNDPAAPHDVAMVEDP